MKHYAYRQRDSQIGNSNVTEQNRDTLRIKQSVITLYCVIGLQINTIIMQYVLRRPGSS